MLSGEDIAELWGERPRGGSKPWTQKLSTEALDWIRAVAETIVEQGAEPASWERLRKRFIEKFPDEVPPLTYSTIKNPVMRFVAELQK